MSPIRAFAAIVLFLSGVASAVYLSGYAALTEFNYALLRTLAPTFVVAGVLATLQADRRVAWFIERSRYRVDRDPLKERHV